MSETTSRGDRIDRRIIAGALVAIAATVLAIVAISGVGAGSPTPSATSGGALPPVGVSPQVVADGRAIPTRTAELTIDAPATVSAVPVALGQQVAAGDVLVSMETDDVDAELAGAVAAQEAASARSAQAAAAADQSTEQVAVAEANLEQAQAALRTARNRNSGERAAAASRDAAAAQVRAAKAGQVAAQEAAKAAAADARRAEAAVDALESSKAGLTLTAPFAGAVASISATVGQQVSPGQILVRVADTSAWEFETTDLDQSGIARIAVGDRAKVTLDGVPGEQIEATVVRVGTYGEDRQGGIVYQVVVAPDGAVPGGIRWNMTATIEILAGE